MKKIIILFSLLMVVLSVHADDISAVKGLVHRLFPGYEQVFSFRKTAGKTDVFSLQSVGRREDHRQRKQCQLDGRRHQPLHEILLPCGGRLAEVGYLSAPFRPAPDTQACHH